ncbi:MAG: PAS domain S-box protein [Candidatus Saganbacteria bacterium]|nr:PAS domain S-box protein [Candidatus Saganbacteria bacterium]
MNKTGIILMILALVVFVAAGIFIVNWQRSERDQTIEEIKNLQTKILLLPDGSALELAKTQYRELVSPLGPGIVLTEINGQIVDANKAYQAMLGYTLAELKKLTYQQITPEKWHAMEKEIVKDAVSKKYVQFKKEYIRKDGRPFAIRLTGWILTNEDGEPVGTGSLVIDISR